MKNDDILGQYLGTAKPPRNQTSATVPSTEPEQVVRRDAGTTLMLDLALRTGERHALPYSYLTGCSMDKEGSLVLRFVDQEVIIRGRNLGPVYSGVVSHTARCIAESGTAFDDEQQDVFIASLEIRTAGAESQL